ncbi:hypothetical protein [Neobacillus sp.]|uniref:hypothetical protein n=1 Tax=Neobacillus sp. TaxID=2675273 RepID=UPI00289741A5|nr:hypothetical protein [Neobacillus sp.]
MLAEIHNKIAANGSNLTDRLEDKLTGDFFGTLRYLPFEIGMKSVLSSVRFENDKVTQEWNGIIQVERGYMQEIEFWYRHSEGEIDLLVPLSNVIIGIEVKYLSGISSEDDTIDNSINYQESCNQLARYSRMMKDISNGRITYLIFLAPYKMMQEVEKTLRNRSIIAPDVKLGFLCWEDILDSLDEIDLSQLEIGQKMIVHDLQSLLMKKGLMRYKGISKDILEKEVSNGPYIFQNGPKITINMSWPTKLIMEEEYYVFNKE